MTRAIPVLTSAVFFAATAVAADDVTLTYMMWSPTQLELEAETIAEFEAANPGVKVEAQAMPPSDYWPKLSALAAAGDLPDVFAMSSGFVKGWAKAGNLADLGPVAESTDLGAYFEGALTPGIVDDQMVAFPQNWVAPVLYYNRDMFDAAGLGYPAADWTWEDFREAAKALTLDTDGDGTTDQWGYWVYGRYAHVDTWMFRNAGQYLNADESALELNDAGANTLAFLSSLVLEDKVAPMPQEMEGIRQQDVFPLGMAAMWVDGSWNIDNVRNVADPSMNWGIAQVPMGPDATADTARAYAWADLMSIADTSDQKDLAWAFIQHMVGEGRTAADFPGGKVPAYRAIAESDAWLETDKKPDNKSLILEIGAQQVYTGFSNNWSGWRGYAAEGSGGVNGELDEVFNGRKSLDDAIEGFTAYGNEVLAR
ncbi:MAG: sugar ABC transporter substrate-binding protein [Pseudomonadota bacterium]